jgi:hypothetical protein
VYVEDMRNFLRPIKYVSRRLTRRKAWCKCIVRNIGDAYERRSCRWPGQSNTVQGSHGIIPVTHSFLDELTETISPLIV